MYRVKIRIRKENQIIDEYWFSSDDKQLLMLSATSWFQGYVRAIGDFSNVRLTIPCVMSIDGYMAWGNVYKMELLNTDNRVVANINDII